VFNEVVREGKEKGAPEASLLESLFKEEIIRVRNLNSKEYLKFVKEMSAESERHPLYEAEACMHFYSLVSLHGSRPKKRCGTLLRKNNQNG
jgi:hypothetical protein